LNAWKEGWELDTVIVFIAAEETGQPKIS